FLLPAASCRRNWLVSIEGSGGIWRLRRGMTALRLILPLTVACAFAIAAFNVVPRGVEAGQVLFAQDHPLPLAHHQLAQVFNADGAAREIEAALALDDADLAQSFLDLARDRNVTLDPALVARVEAANSTMASTRRAARHFGRGLIVGETDSLVGLAGTTVCDLLVVGDVRDAVEGGRRVGKGERADKLVLGLSCVAAVVPS